MKSYQKLLLNNLNLFTALILLVFSGFTFQLRSQDDTLIDSLITGQRYRITLYNEKEIIGKVVKQDSVYAYIVSESGTSRVKKEDIFSFSKNVSPKIFKALFSLGGGVIIPSNVNHSYNALNRLGFSIQFSALKPLDENRSLRIDLSFGRVKREVGYYPIYPYDGSYSSPSDLFRDIYTVNGNFIFGNNNTDSKFSMYGLIGLGMLIIREGDYSYTYYNSYDSTYHNYTEKGFSEAYFNISLGGGLRFNLKNRIGAYAEIQYNMFTNGGYFLFFGSGYFPIRAGLTYTFY
ncbi:MAG: hypothetical protein IT281_08045 [Ignavibacteria bacterium]|nr:hypothetical protein [Ignavibacteria bacterium]